MDSQGLDSSGEMDHDEDDYRSIEYWRPHFSENSVISLQYYTVNDGTKLLVVHAENKKFPDRKPVIIIPGWFSMVFGWSEVTQELSKHTSILYVETREKKSSILPNHEVEMSVERMADDFSQQTHIFPYDISNTIVVCSSMGGTLMLEYLGRMERLPHTTILIGPNPEFDVPRIPIKIALRLPLFVVNPMKWLIKWYIRQFRIDMKKEPQQYDKYATVLDNAEPWKIRQSARECLSYEAWDVLEEAEINSNVILVGATADKMHDAAQTIKVHEIINGSEFVDFPSNKATHSKEMAEFVIDMLN